MGAASDQIVRVTLDIGSVEQIGVLLLALATALIGLGWRAPESGKKSPAGHRRPPGWLNLPTVILVAIAFALSDVSHGSCALLR